MRKHSTETLAENPPDLHLLRRSIATFKAQFKLDETGNELSSHVYARIRRKVSRQSRDKANGAPFFIIYLEQ